MQMCSMSNFYMQICSISHNFHMQTCFICCQFHMRMSISHQLHMKMCSISYQFQMRVFLYLICSICVCFLYFVRSICGCVLFISFVRGCVVIILVFYTDALYILPVPYADVISSVCRCVLYIISYVGYFFKVRSVATLKHSENQKCFIFNIQPHLPAISLQSRCSDVDIFRSVVIVFQYLRHRRQPPVLSANSLRWSAAHCTKMFVFLRPFHTRKEMKITGSQVRADDCGQSNTS